jgi:hypothetical protein
MQLTEENITRFDHTQLHMTYERWPEYFIDAARIRCKLMSEQVVYMLNLLHFYFYVSPFQ